MFKPFKNDTDFFDKVNKLYTEWEMNACWIYWNADDAEHSYRSPCFWYYIDDVCVWVIQADMEQRSYKYVITSMYVLPEHRKKWIWKELVKYIDNYCCTRLDVKKKFVVVYDNQLESLNFRKKVWFTKEAGHIQEYKYHHKLWFFWLTYLQYE